MIKRAMEYLKSGKLISSISFRLIGKPYSLSERNVFIKQRVLLTHILKAAKAHCGYYKNLKKSATIVDFPIVDKKLITANFSAFCADNARRFVYENAFTGGSTGEPFHFYRSGGYESEFGLRKWKQFGYQNGDIILAMDGTKIEDEKLKQGVYWCDTQKDDIPFGSQALSSLYLNDRNARAYCEYIMKMKPSFLRGYPAFLYSMSCYMDQYAIGPISFLKGIELTSESVQDYQIEKIKKTFHAPVFLQYGHSEACVFAYTYDETYRYRVEPLYGFVEILDGNGKHVGVNEVGEVVVTTLHNFAMPLIRYKTGDLAEYGGKDDRFIYLNKVLGRTQDYIFNRTGDKVLLTALIFGQHCSAMGNIIKWQLEQFEPGKLLIHIIKSREYTGDDEKMLYDLFKHLGGVESKFDYVVDIPLTARGKSNMLVQHINTAK